MVDARWLPEEKEKFPNVISNGHGEQMLVMGMQFFYLFCNDTNSIVKYSQGDLCSEIVLSELAGCLFCELAFQINYQCLGHQAQI